MEDILGLYDNDINTLQACARAVVVFIIAFLYIKISGMRSFGKGTALDVTITIILGSVLARTIGGGIPFIPSIFGALVLALVHRLLAYITQRNQRLERFIQGTSILVVKDGEMLCDNMEKCHITEDDLIESMRLTANISSLAEVKEAYYERTGEISVVRQ